jgi:phosphatidate cytidylyltransferase
MNLEKLNPLAQRLIISGISIALVFITLYYSYSPFFAPVVPVIAFLVIGFATKEYYQIAKIKGLQPRIKIGLAVTLLYVVAIYLSTQAAYLELMPLICLLVSMVAVFTSYFIRGKNPFENIAVTLFGIVYLTIPLACTIQINYFFAPEAEQDGRLWLFFVLAITYLTDSCALIVGKSIGRTKLASFISPNKTWEGAVGGLIFAVAASLLFSYFAEQGFIPIRLTFRESILLGAALSVLAQIGDLSESLLKRDAGVKDSSKIPGLGGLLDVIDSLVFTAPVVYLYLKFQNP